MKLKRKEILKEEKKNCCEDELENSKNSVNNLQKSFRIRNQRSLSELRENNEKFNNVAKKKQEIVQQKLNMITNFTNKHLIHNKMQKRPDTTGAKNREKKYVIVEKNDKNQQKINQEFIKEKVSTQNLNIPDSIKDKFKEDFIEKMRNEQETHSIINNHPLDIKKEFSTDLFDEFKFGELLGEGAYAQVFKVLLPKKGNFVAVKVIKLIKGSDESNADQLKGLRNEINLLQRLNHKHIVSYLGCKQQKDNFYIFMEHLSGGSISSMLKQYGRFDEQVIRKFVRQLLQGLEYLHSQGVVHSDLKGANILSDGCGNVKLADFGASRHLENLPLLSVTGSCENKSAKGSLYWMAPEIFNQEKHGRKIDIWSLGCTVIEMASAKHPWPDCKSFTELVVQVMTLKCPPIPEHLSEQCKDFIKRCCMFDKNQRPTAKELFSHEFLKIE